MMKRRFARVALAIAVAIGLWAFGLWVALDAPHVETIKSQECDHEPRATSQVTVAPRPTRR